MFFFWLWRQPCLRLLSGIVDFRGPFGSWQNYALKGKLTLKCCLQWHANGPAGTARPFCWVARLSLFERPDWDGETMPATSTLCCGRPNANWGCCSLLLSGLDRTFQGSMEQGQNLFERLATCCMSCDTVKTPTMKRCEAEAAPQHCINHVSLCQSLLSKSFLFVTRGYVWIIPASSCKHFDSKTLLCIMIGADNVSIRLVLFSWGGFFWITGFWKYSYSEVRVATWYGSTWLEERASWVSFRAETRLGAWAYAAAEDFLRLHLREGRRWQVQLPFHGAAFRQLQLMRGQLQQWIGSKDLHPSCLALGLKMGPVKKPRILWRLVYSKWRYKGG